MGNAVPRLILPEESILHSKTERAFATLASSRKLHERRSRSTIGTTETLIFEGVVEPEGSFLSPRETKLPQPTLIIKALRFQPLSFRRVPGIKSRESFGGACHYSSW